MTERIEIEPFDQFAKFVTRFTEAEGIAHLQAISPRHLAEIHRVAKELGVIYHDEDGTLELIRQ